MKKTKSILALNIANRRKALGFSQREFAAFVGIGESTLKEIETDLSPGSQPIKEAIAHALHCTVEDLYSGETPKAVHSSKTIYQYVRTLEREVLSLKIRLKKSEPKDKK